METKECFRCKERLPLHAFAKASKFVLKCDLGTCRVCKLCEIERANNDLSIVSYNKKFHAYDVIKFRNKEEVENYFIHVLEDGY